VGQAAHSGRNGLRLVARPVDPRESPGALEAPPVWITSGPVHLSAGTLICVYGWVQVRQPIEGSVDGLLILDSASGEALAERIRQTSGWQKFVLYRVVSQTGPMTVTFALSGLGEVWLDDVGLSVLEPVAAR